MASKSQFLENDSLIDELLIDDFFSKSGEKSARPLFDEEAPLASLKGFFEPSAPQGLRTNSSIAVWSDKKRKLLRVFVISGGAIALLLLTLRAGNYLFTNYPPATQASTIISKIKLPAKKPIVPLSDLNVNPREGELLTIPPPPLKPAPKEKKSFKARSPAKQVKALSSPKPKKRPPAVTQKKEEKNAGRVYKLYINRKFILGETRAISLKLFLLGIENKIVKRKDGGYTIFAGEFKELSKARGARKKVLDAGYQATIYSVAKN